MTVDAPTDARFSVLASTSIAAALAALVATVHFEARADEASTPGEHVIRVSSSEDPLRDYRPWREVIGDASPSDCESQDGNGSSDYSQVTRVCRRMLGPVPLVETSRSSGVGAGLSVHTSHAVTIESATVGRSWCLLDEASRDGSERDPHASGRANTGELLYAYDHRREEHGYRCTASRGGGPIILWTVLYREPDPRTVALWEASRPVVPCLRALATALLVCATTLAARWSRRERSHALPWREATQGADGVLREGDIVVNAPQGAVVHPGTSAMCVVLPESRESGTYRNAASATATHLRIGTLAALQ